MNKLDAIARSKTLRKALDGLLQETKDFRKQLIEGMRDPQTSKEFEDGGEVIAQVTLSQRDIEGAIMRQGMALKYVGTPNPYPESKLTAEDLAAKSYAAYSEATGGKSAVTGNKLPTWEALCKMADDGDERMNAVKAGWLAVANANPALVAVAPTADGMKM